MLGTKATYQDCLGGGGAEGSASLVLTKLFVGGPMGALKICERIVRKRFLFLSFFSLKRCHSVI